MRRLPLALLAGLLLAGPALASGPRAGGPDEIKAWRGRYCTAPGCARAEAAPMGSLAGFGVAALGALWLGRRRA